MTRRRKTAQPQPQTCSRLFRRQTLDWQQVSCRMSAYPRCQRLQQTTQTPRLQRSGLQNQQTPRRHHRSRRLLQHRTRHPLPVTRSHRGRLQLDCRSRRSARRRVQERPRARGPRTAPLPLQRGAWRRGHPWQRRWRRVRALVRVRVRSPLQRLSPRPRYLGVPSLRPLRRRQLMPRPDRAARTTRRSRKCSGRAIGSTLASPPATR